MVKQCSCYTVEGGIYKLSVKSLAIDLTNCYFVLPIYMFLSRFTTARKAVESIIDSKVIQGTTFIGVFSS